LKCKRCGQENNLTWDKQHYENTGTWRLWDNDRERPHECPKTATPIPKEKIKKACYLCARAGKTVYFFDTDKYKKHLTTFHLI